MGESRTPLETRRFLVTGITSAEDVVRAENALISVPGVHQAIVDWEHKQALVRVADYVSDNLLSEAINAAGFSLTKVATPQLEHDSPLDDRSNGQPDEPPAESEPDPAGPALPEQAPSGSPATEDDQEPAQRPVWQRVWFYGSRTVIYSVALTLALTLIYRVLPVPTTMLMLHTGLIEGRPVQRDWVELNQISPNLVRAVIASEDNEFCRHWGFDFKEMEDAWKESKRGGRLRGASTITQQTAKNVFLWPGRSWIRKGLEAYFTVLIEGLWPKHRIMEVYLNVIEWGPGVFGAEAAARKWFKKSASKLTQLEAARLAAILPNPIRYRANPPGPYVNSRGYTISARANNVDLNGADNCAKP